MIPQVTDSTPASPLDTAASRPSREACRDVEGLFLGTLLRQVLASASGDSEDGTGQAILTDFAAEQAGRQLGRSAPFGLADMLERQLSQPGSRTPAR
jgi:Rod binding domain-containing protein